MGTEIVVLNAEEEQNLRSLSILFQRTIGLWSFVSKRN